HRPTRDSHPGDAAGVGPAGDPRAAIHPGVPARLGRIHPAPPAVGPLGAPRLNGEPGTGEPPGHPGRVWECLALPFWDDPTLSSRARSARAPGARGAGGAELLCGAPVALGSPDPLAFPQAGRFRLPGPEPDGPRAGTFLVDAA